MLVGGGVRLVPVLVGEVVAAGVGGDDLLGLRNGAVRAELARGVDDLGTEGAEEEGALLADVLGHDADDVVAAQLADEGETDAGVARGGLEDGVSGLELAALLGRLDHRLGDTVLDRAGGVLALELGVDVHVGAGREGAQLDEGGIADEVEDGAVEGHGGAGTSPRRGRGGCRGRRRR